MMLNKEDLAQFTGTENYYRNFLGLVYTDGVKFMAENAGAYWLIDAIASYQNDKRMTPDLRAFQLWELKIKGSSAELEMRGDSDQPIIISQLILYTDFPFDIKLYVCDRVLMLPSEY